MASGARDVRVCENAAGIGPAAFTKTTSKILSAMNEREFI